MANLKRLDTLEIATSDLKQALETYRGNFGLTPRRLIENESAFLSIGDSEIRLLGGAGAADGVSSRGDGMAAVYLEADDVDQIAAALMKAGYPECSVRIDHGRRVLTIDPKVAHRVALFIFDRKG
jgi:predicted enzyme related to lactoylglutathione lyase